MQGDARRPRISRLRLRGSTMFRLRGTTMDSRSRKRQALILAWIMCLLPVRATDAADRAAAEKLVAEASAPEMKDRHDEAADLCTQAIAFDPNYVKAYIRR